MSTVKFAYKMGLSKTPVFILPGKKEHEDEALIRFPPQDI